MPLRLCVKHFVNVNVDLLKIPIKLYIKPTAGNHLRRNLAEKKFVVSRLILSLYKKISKLKCLLHTSYEIRQKLHRTRIVLPLKFF